jgi:hypothetical protein
LFDDGRERGAAIDVEQASDQIDALIDKRAAGRERATAEEESWKASVRRHHAKLRGRRKAEWFCYWSALADSLRKSADEFEAKAQALLQDEPNKGSKA